MNNASKNLEAVLACIIKGIDVQFQEPSSAKWSNLSSPSFALTVYGLTCKWRKKPDPFQDAWDKQLPALIGSSYEEKSIASHYFQKGWQEALKNKGAK